MPETFGATSNPIEPIACAQASRASEWTFLQTIKAEERDEDFRRMAALIWMLAAVVIGLVGLVLWLVSR